MVAGVKKMAARLAVLALAVLLAAAAAGCGAASASLPGSSGAADVSPRLPEQSAADEPQVTSELLPAEHGGKFMHFSLDDVLSILADLTVNEDVYQSAFEQPILGFLQRMNREYGMVTSLYCFYRNHDASFSLADVTGRFAEELAANAHWLRFGFHSRDIDTTYGAPEKVGQAGEDYAAAVRELQRITGGTAAIDTMVRLHYFSASRPALESMQQNGLSGLLCGWNTEDENYYLDETLQKQLFGQDIWIDPENGLVFTPTDIWIEALDSLPAALEGLAAGQWKTKGETLVVFTHEWAMDEAMMDSVEQCAGFAHSHGYGFAFPMDRLAAVPA